MGEEEKARKELEQCRSEHSQLNIKIEAITKETQFDQILVQRMKRRKLWLKDRMLYLQGFLCDDIIA
jgi:hypothetical protein